MHPLENKVKKIIQRENLLAPNETVVVGVSAGPDSMALLHLLHALRGDFAVTLVAVYVDHGLRPGEAAGEKQLVQEQAAILGVDACSGVMAVREYAREQGISVEHGARILRYGFLEKIAAQRGASRIAVAHTADDQAEEVLLRLIRGTGRKGLSGMLSLRAGKIIRPLLGLTKEELLRYLAHGGIPFLEDSSNRERLYLRNRVRLDLLPYLAEHFNPNIRETLRRTAAILQDEEALLEGLAARAYEAAVQETAGQGATPPGLEIVLAAFLAQPRALQRRILETALWRLESRPGFRQIEALLHLAGSAEAGARLHLAQGLRVGRQADRLVFSLPRGRVCCRGDLSPPEQKEFELIVHEPGTYAIPEIGRLVRLERLPGTVSAAALKAEQGANFLDAEQVSFPLSIRSVRPGDRFWPHGAPGAKKVADFFTDRKIPPAKRRQVPVLVCGNKIVALIGLRIDHRVRLTGETRQVLRLSVEPL